MQEGRPAQGPAVGQRRRPFGGIEHELDPAIGDAVHDVGPALQDLVDLRGVDAVLGEKPLGARSGDHREAEFAQQLDRAEDTRLVRVPDGNEQRPLLGYAGAPSELALGERHGE